jgi:hypothetical protein
LNDGNRPHFHPVGLKAQPYRHRNSDQDAPIEPRPCASANPWRLDLDWRWHRRGLEMGCLFSINPDAHSIAEIDLTRWGVAMARKGGVSPQDVLNCLDLSALTARLASRRTGTTQNSKRRSRGTGKPVKDRRRSPPRSKRADKAA